jgi:hypothetical protein
MVTPEGIAQRLAKEDDGDNRETTPVAFRAAPKKLMLSSAATVDRRPKTRSRIATGPQMNRSKVTNSEKMLPGLDG